VLPVLTPAEITDRALLVGYLRHTHDRAWAQMAMRSGIHSGIYYALPAPPDPLRYAETIGRRWDLARARS
jgi:hypothetical protein